MMLCGWQELKDKLHGGRGERADAVTVVVATESQQVRRSLGIIRRVRALRSHRLCRKSWALAGMKCSRIVVPSPSRRGVIVRFF